MRKLGNYTFFMKILKTLMNKITETNQDMALPGCNPPISTHVVIFPFLHLEGQSRNKNHREKSIKLLYCNTNGL